MKKEAAVMTTSAGLAAAGHPEIAAAVITGLGIYKGLKAFAGLFGKTKYYVKFAEFLRSKNFHFFTARLMELKAVAAKLAGRAC